MSFSLNQKLALFAFSLSFLTMVVSLLIPRHSEEKENPEIAFIDVIELATKIKNKEPILVIDVRDEREFQQFHIPSASHIPLDKLLEENLKSKQSTIVYSANDQLANQAYYMLKGLEVSSPYVLKGGVNDWYDRILYPKVSLKVSDSDKTLTNQIKSLSSFYGGKVEFVNDTTVLNYYKGIESSRTKKEKPKLVRMGC